MRKQKMDIIYEDKNIIVINKPAGLLTISTDKEREHTLFREVSEYEKKKHKSNKVFIIHRLDRDTSGVIVFAKNMNYKSLFQNNWEELVKCREYIAIVEGHVEKPTGTIKSWLKENKNFITFSSNRPHDGKLAITKYKVLDTCPNFTLLRVNIETGRKNQIRVHMSEMGNSIIGDEKYGSKTNPIRRMGLHASKLEIIHPVTKQLLVFEAKMPIPFYKLFDKKKFTD